MSDVPPADAPADLRRRTAALHRLAAELATAANPHAIAFLVSTTAARLLEADACGVFSRTDVGALTTLHSSGWPAATAGQFTRVELQARAPAVGRGARRHAGVAGGRRSSGGTATPRWPRSGRRAGSRRPPACPCACEDRDLGAVVFSFLTPRAVPRGRARVPAGGRRPVRPGAGPRPAPGRRAGRARRRRAPARPDDVPRPGGPPDGGAPVGRGAPAATRGPRRPGHRRLVRGPPRPRGPGRRGGGRPRRSGEGRVRRPAAGALPARPERARRGDRGQPHRSAGVLPRDPRRAARRRGGGRGAPAAHPVDRAALGGDRAAARARPQPGRADAGARRVRAAVRRGRPRLHRAAGGCRGDRPGQRPALRGAAVGSRRRCRTRCSRPCSRTCPGCAWPPATGRRPTTGPGCTSGATSTTSSRATRRARWACRRGRRVRQGPARPRRGRR